MVISLLHTLNDQVVNSNSIVAHYVVYANLRNSEVENWLDAC